MPFRQSGIIGRTIFIVLEPIVVITLIYFASVLRMRGIPLIGPAGRMMSVVNAVNAREVVRDARVTGMRRAMLASYAITNPQRLTAARAGQRRRIAEFQRIVVIEKIIVRFRTLVGGRHHDGSSKEWCHDPL